MKTVIVTAVRDRPDTEKRFSVLADPAMVRPGGSSWEMGKLDRASSAEPLTRLWPEGGLGFAAYCL